MRCFSLLWLFATVCILLFSSINHVYAGAWTQDKGSSQLIISGNYYTADHLWDNNGTRRSQPTYRKYELDPYFEYGLWNGLTIGGSTSLQRIGQNAFPTSNRQTNWGVGDSEVFARQRLWKHNGMVVSLEPMIKLPSPSPSSSTLRLGGSHPDVGMGLSAGYGFEAYKQNHFIDVDSQYRYRLGSPHDQINVAGTMGIALSSQWMVMPQAFATFRTGSSSGTGSFTESSADDYDLLKLQLSALYNVNKDVSLQLGGFSAVDGKNTGIGRGLLLTVWTHL